jgi:hypothetical protein
MTDDIFSFVDDIFCALADKEENQMPISASEQVVLDVWHSFGLIENGGFHNYLCFNEDDLHRIIISYKTAGLKECALYIEKAENDWKKYLSENRKVDADHFREIYRSHLDEIEDGFYGFEKEMISSLSKYIKKCQIG